MGHFIFKDIEPAQFKDFANLLESVTNLVFLRLFYNFFKILIKFIEFFEPIFFCKLYLFFLKVKFKITQIKFQFSKQCKIFVIS